MTKAKKWLVRIIAIVLALIMAGSLIFGAVSSIRAQAASQSELNQLKEKQQSLQQKQKEIQSKINSLEYEQSSALAKKEVLDEKVDLTQQEINNVNNQIDEHNELIKIKKKEIVKAQEEEDKQWELYKDRIRVMEENGTISYFAVIFGATSFSDLLSRIDFVSEIIEYDEIVYKQLIAAKEATIAAKESLEEEKKGLEDSKAELETLESELQAQVEEASALLKQMEDDLAEYQKLNDEAEEAESKVAKEIDEMVEELERQEKAAREAEEQRKNNGGGSGGGGGGGGSAVTATGSFIWPASSVYITSEFGTRIHPITGKYKFHAGVDIGASYGTNVRAADGGNVITSAYDSSYGNYVVIYHGNNKTTLYAHMSQRYVSAGDTVSQGDVIGLVGSTGSSTGPHLHFEIRIDGSCVNPLQYFSNYIIC